MSYRHSVPIENFEAEKFSKKFRKQIELVEGKLLLAKKRMESGLDEEEHHKQYRRTNYLERYMLWLEDCIQDLDDIQKGVPWKYNDKCGNIWARRVSPGWYEWKDPSIKEAPKENVKVRCVTKEESQGTQRSIRNVSKQEALLCLGYSPGFVAILKL